MNFQLIHVQRIANNFAPIARTPKFKQPVYIGIAIEEDGHYYYWARGISLKITQDEYWQIKANPKLYYFSTALKLHHRIDRALKEGDSHAF